MGIFSTLFGGRGSSQGGSYSQTTLLPYPAALPPYYGIHSPGVADIGEAPATDATNRILDASTATLPAGWSESRASSATYYNSSGVVSTASSNTLRNDYTSGGVLRGYLLEPASSNIAKWSGGINTANSPWTTDPSQSITSTTVADPAGGTSASTISISGSVGGAVYQLQQPITIGAVYTVSAWVKQSASGASTHIRLTTNTAGAFNSGISGKFALTSTWTRVSITGVIGSVNTGLGAVSNFGFDNRDETGTRDSNVSGNIDVWGMQCELGSLLTSYIATTTASVSRPADVASFTVNSSATDLTLTYDNGATQTYTGVPPGSTFNVPTSNTLRLLYVNDNVLAGINAAVDQSLGALSQSFASTVTDAASYANTLGALQQTLTATVPDTAAVAQTLDALSQAATAVSLCVLNPADKSASITLSNGNLTGTANTGGAHALARGTWPGSANRYFEVVWSTLPGTGPYPGIGLVNSSQSLSQYIGFPSTTTGVGYFADGFYTDTAGVYTGGPTFTTGDVMGVELLASSIKFYKNGTLIQTTTFIPSGSLYPALDVYASGDSATFNFGATALSYLPTGDTSWDGSQTGGRTATVAQTLGDLVQTTPAAVTVAGVVAQTLGALSQTATATAIDAASVAQTLGALTQTATSTVQVAAAVAQTLGALGQTTTATVQAAAVVAQTLGALSQSLTATVADAAVVSQTLGALGQTATAAATDTATTSQTLGALNQTATAIHVAANAVVNQTLGALGQTATAAATDTAAVAQTLGALQQAVTAAAEVAATTAQTLGSLQQLAATAVTDTATFQGNLAALQQTATGAAQVNAAVTQLLGDLGQTATVAVVGQAVVDQVLPSLQQELISSDSRHALAAQTLGDLAQTASSTVDITAAIAQTLGGLTQLTGATVDILVNTIQTLGTLAQAASATVPSSTAIDALVAQSLAVLGQAATGRVTVATAVSQVLATLGQITTGGPQTAQVLQLEQTLAGNVLVRATLSQLLQGLQQAAATVLPPATTIMPESVATVMYEHRILVVPAEARVLVVPGMYATVGAGGLGELLGPVARLPGEHLLPPIRQVITATGADLGPALPDNIIVLEEDNFSALLWEDSSFFEMEDDTVSVISVDFAVALEEGGFLLTEAGDTLGLEEGTIQVIATLPDDLGLLLEDGSALLTEDGMFLGLEGIEALPAIDAIVLEEGIGFLLLEDGDILSLETGTVVPVTAPSATARQVLPFPTQLAAMAHAPIPAILTTWSPSDRAANILLSNSNLTATIVSVPPGGGGGGGGGATLSPLTAQAVQTLPSISQVAGIPSVTLNPFDKHSQISLSNNNLTASAVGSITDSAALVRATVGGVTNGYFEVVFSATAFGVGISNLSQILTHYPGDPNGATYFSNGYNEWTGSGFGQPFAPTWATGDVIGVWVKASTVEFYKNGVLSFTATTLPSGVVYPTITMGTGGAATIRFIASSLAFLPSDATPWGE
jgi:hypothetical protein